MFRRDHLKNAEKYEVRRVIKEKTDYEIESTNLLNQVFRRSSAAAEMGRSSNEILEFIGDKVLSFIVVKIVAEKCGSSNATNDYAFRIKENRFTQIEQTLVNNQSLAKIIDEMDIAKYLILSKSDIINEVNKETKAKADLLEAIIGAIAISSNWDIAVLEKAVRKLLDMDKKITDMIEGDENANYFDIAFDNAVTALKELAEQNQCTMPKYKFAGPDCIETDSDQNPKWMCTCSIINGKTGITRVVTASSKKDAKKAAAYLILCEHLNIPNKYYPDKCYSMFWIYKDGKLFPEQNDKKGE